jgi:6-phosphofructokinase 2
VVDTKDAALARALDAGVFLIKPNIHELEQLVGRELAGDRAVAEAAGEIVDRGGAEVALVSLGRGGAMLVTADGVEHLRAPVVPLGSKVGAGDSMVGGLAVALARGRELRDAARYAVAAGAAAVMTPGTELCRAEDVERLDQQMASQAVESGPMTG